MIQVVNRYKLELNSLIMEMWQELNYLAEEPVKPDFKRYLALDECGQLLIITALHQGKLVGISTVVLDHNMHFSDTKYALVDLIYLTKEYRKGSNGIRMIRFVNDAIISKGIKYVIIASIIEFNRDLGKVLKRMGFNLTQQSFIKKLERE